MQYNHLFIATLQYTLSVLGRDKGYTIKYNPLPEGVPEGEARGNSWRQRVIFDRLSQVEFKYRHFIILTINRLMFTALFSLTSPYTP